MSASEQQIRQELEQIEARRRRLRKELRKHKGLPTRKPGSFWRKGHEYLSGAKEHFQRRIEIYRNAGGDIAVFEVSENVGLVDDLKSGMCQGCAETHPVGWYEGEWHHNVKTLGGKRCDCVACALWVCADFHRRYHNRVIKSAKVQAA